MGIEENVEIVKRGYAAFGRGDIETLLGLFAEDVSWTSPEVEGVGFGGSLRGREAVAEMFGALAAAEDIQEFVQDEYIAQGDRVVVTGRSKAVIRSTGKTVETGFVHLFTVRDGKVQDFVEFFDTARTAKGYQQGSGAGA